ncbi:MAG TPA: DNA internalization-related competence protein ComEC/Rec2, partial [Gemmatimonadaceae bacterium]|nr:DNA internalization-related competence protein ComEC/Rec2 [Gemmatimonadaceae bacterium]
MPLVAYSLGVYLAGLLAGFQGSVLVICAAGIGAGALGALRGRAVATTFSVLAFAGAAVAREEAREDDACARDAARRPALTVVLEHDFDDGGFVRGRILPCGGSVSISADHGHAVAGTVVIANGDVVSTTRGLLVQHAELRVVRGPSLLARWRNHAGAAIDRTFGADAPLVRALLIADRHDLSPELRDQFAAAGLAHILAIAGLHVGIIALAIEIALQLIGVPRQRAALVTIAAVILYVAIIGAPVPAVRSAAMLTVLLTTRIAQRPTSRWAIVTVGACHPLIDPRVVLDAGYQLSVVGVASMISAGIVSRRIGVHRLHWLLKSIALTLIGTTIATIGSAPVVAWVFGRVSLVAPLSNLAATPLLELAQPMIFAGMLVAPIRPLASIFADAAHPILVGLTFVASHAASLPGASIPVAPTVLATGVTVVMSGAVIVACASREWRGPLAIAGAAVAALIWLPLAPATSADVELHMMDVGQGDAIGLRTPHGRWILVDAGPAWRAGDAGRSTVMPYIGRRGGTVELFVLSHPHTDHVGGAPTIFRAMHPATYIDAGFPGSAETYRASLDLARREGIHWRRARPGDVIAIDGVTLRILAPDSAWTASLNDPNLASVVLIAEYGDVRMLFMGDAERPEEEWLLEHAHSQLHADVLKVGHHGSKTSSSEPFLDAVSPRLALVSVGAGNTYHLPTP